MDEPAIDLHDYRRRLLRLALALVVAAVFTAITMTGIHAVSGTPDRNPIGSSAPALVAIIIFVMSTVGAHIAISAIGRRLSSDRVGAASLAPGPRHGERRAGRG